MDESKREAETFATDGEDRNTDTLLHEAEVYGARDARERDASPSVEILTDVEDRLTLPEVKRKGENEKG